MSKHLLKPQGDFPAATLGRRLAAMFYDFLLCTALMIVTAFIYKLIWIAFMGEARMRTLTGRIQADCQARRSAALSDWMAASLPEPEYGIAYG